MCGIAGIFDLNGRGEINRSLLERMNDSLKHRGPDGFGYHIEPGLGLGHRRLSIIDLAGGQQPLFNEDDTVAVTYNGEIYNFRSLTEELLSRGHQFRTRCDTEVIVHAWEEWGENCVDHFNGMFAFAIWDRNRQQLFLARDRLGIKPLHYGITPDNRLLFASELKGLVAHPDLKREICPLAVEEYFTFGYVPDPKTILTTAFKLAPGHTLLIRRGEPMPAPRQYWDVVFNQGESVSDKEIQAELIARLTESVRMRLVSEVPLGAFLSGGVDSSAIVALMAEISNEAINTCSISFGDPAFNEARFAAKVSDQYRTRHRVEQVDADDFSLIDRLVDLYDEPYADSSAIPTYRVCQLARENVTVALSGDGGDENFAGYRRYRWHAHEEVVRSMLPLSVRRNVFGVLGALYPKLDWAPKVLRAKSTFQAIARDSVDAYLHSVSILTPDVKSRLFSKSFGNSLEGYSAREVFRRHADRAQTDDPLSLVQYLDFKTYLPGDILTKVDRASMAHSLEVRVPLLDHEFVTWVAGLDPDLKLRGREGKYVFKKSLESKLSSDILYREKMGFAVPLNTWFRGPLKHRIRDTLLGERLRATGIFDQQYLQRMLAQNESGVRQFSTPIWSLLMFEGFLRRTMGC
jgi:asparagine synthase (glutamine-hydrolysing)